MDPGGGDCELPVVGIELAPVIAADQRLPTDLAELLRILLLDLAPPAMPFIPLVLCGTLQIPALALSPWNPSDTVGDGAPCLDAGGEVVAEKRYAEVHPGEALTEMCEQGHACPDIRCKIQNMEAIDVHDVVEEVGERGVEPAGEVIDKERIFI